MGAVDLVIQLSKLLALIISTIGDLHENVFLEEVVFVIINFNCEGMGPPTIWREMILMYFATNMLKFIMVLRKRDS